MTTPPAPEGPATVLLVDHEAATRAVLGPRLRRGCGRVLEADSVAAALVTCREHVVDLVVVSARVPDGAEDLCRELRRRGGPPIVAYGVGTSPDAHIRWLDAGGDDCLSGDDPVLLAARCRATLRRHRIPLTTWRDVR